MTKKELIKEASTEAAYPIKVTEEIPHSLITGCDFFSFL